MAEMIERELGWDDEIENDGSPSILLPAGEYEFTVESFERSRFPGSEKVPPCNQATLKLGIDAPEGHATISCNLFLHTKFEWKLCQFFTSIGQRKHGEKLKMDWRTVPGAKGRCKITRGKYTSNRDGKERDKNDIDEFLAPPEGTQAATATPTGGWTQGAF